MADAVDSKSTARKGITVQVRAPAPLLNRVFASKYAVFSSYIGFRVKRPFLSIPHHSFIQRVA